MCIQFSVIPQSRIPWRFVFFFLPPQCFDCYAACSQRRGVQFVQKIQIDVNVTKLFGNFDPTCDKVAFSAETFLIFWRITEYVNEINSHNDAMQEIPTSVARFLLLLCNDKTPFWRERCIYRAQTRTSIVIYCEECEVPFWVLVRHVHLFFSSLIIRKLCLHSLLWKLTEAAL